MKNKQNILPFSIVVLATHGDINAINNVIKHFENYIIRLSQKMVFDEYGVLRPQIDEETKRLLETKLIAAVLKFKIELI